MKLLRWGEIGQEQPGVLSSDGVPLDCSEFGEDWNEEFFGSNGIERLAIWLRKNSDRCSVLDKNIRLGPPIGRPSKIICVGLNYENHARESGMDIPELPVLFMKSTTSIVGPNDNIVIPSGSQKTDWEVELAIVIGQTARSVTEESACQYIAGYMLHNDVSEREFQFEHGGQWVKGKSCDSFAPIGPYLVTGDEIADPHNLDLWLELNGERIQNSNTSDMIFSIPMMISHISRYMTLLPGDVISTGTPFGVGLGMDPPKYLKPGDVIELGIENLGVGRQVVVGSAA